MRVAVFRLIVNRWLPNRPDPVVIFEISDTTIITAATKIRAV